MTFNKRFFRPLISFGLALTIAFTGAVTALPAHASAATVTASTTGRIISYGENFLGTPYRYGAPQGQTSVLDCSLFTKTVYKHFGIYLPRSSRQQAQVGTYVPRSQLRKGDLVFFSTRSSNGRIAHVGIYAGNGKILHTYGGPGVTYSSLNSKWWSSHYITARRVIH